MRTESRYAVICGTPLPRIYPCQSFEPVTADIALTISHSLVGKAIQFDQRFICGFPAPAWRYTHTRICVGAQLMQSLVQAACWMGLMSSADLQLYSLRGPWFMSVTSPTVRFDHWREIAQENFAIFRLRHIDGHSPYYQPVNDGDTNAVQGEAFKLFGRTYDYPQLVTILLHDILGVDSTKYSHRFEWGRRYTVCSGGAVALLEVLRRRREDNKKPVWPRLFNCMHAERAHPADLASSPRGFLGMGKKRWDRDLFLVAGSGAHHLPHDKTPVEEGVFNVRLSSGNV